MGGVRCALCPFTHNMLLSPHHRPIFLLDSREGINAVWMTAVVDKIWCLTCRELQKLLQREVPYIGASLGVLIASTALNVYILLFALSCSLPSSPQGSARFHKVLYCSVRGVLVFVPD